MTNLHDPKWNEYEYKHWLKYFHDDIYYEWEDSGLQETQKVYDWVALSHPEIEQSWHEHKRFEKFQRSNK